MKNQPHKTAITRKSPTAPSVFLKENGYLKGKKLDYGCGKSVDAEIYEMDKFDPHYHPDVNLNDNQYDTILCTYVLNVIDDPEVEKEVLNKIRKLLKPDGKAYLSVRRDIKTEGYTSKGTFQKNVELKLPKLIDKKGSFCIYELSKD